jgi:hypothetical protein
MPTGKKIETLIIPIMTINGKAFTPNVLREVANIVDAENIEYIKSVHICNRPEKLPSGQSLIMTAKIKYESN